MKGLLIHELVDGIREMVMQKRYLRIKIGREMTDDILPKYNQGAEPYHEQLESGQSCS